MADFIPIFLGCVLCFFIGGTFGTLQERIHWEQEAIKRGHALYCPNTGDFAWMGECGE